MNCSSEDIHAMLWKWHSDEISGNDFGLICKVSFFDIIKGHG